MCSSDLVRDLARYGTLAPGKVANLVVWSGDPLELSTQEIASLTAVSD